MLKRTLVANRGEIACRILRACKEADIEGVAIHAANAVVCSFDKTFLPNAKDGIILPSFLINLGCNN